MRPPQRPRRTEREMQSLEDELAGRMAADEARRQAFEDRLIGALRDG